jgi:hypothetical protein
MIVNRKSRFSVKTSIEISLKAHISDNTTHRAISAKTRHIENEPSADKHYCRIQGVHPPFKRLSILMSAQNEKGKGSGKQNGISDISEKSPEVSP